MRNVDLLELVETIREGFLVLEPDLTIRFANRSFCATFAVAPEEIVGRKLPKLGDGQWDIPALRSALETVIPVARPSRPSKSIRSSRGMVDG
jgi:PAS domain-containing protein